MLKEKDLDKYIINRKGTKYLSSLCGLEDLRLTTTSISMVWGKSALVPSISISAGIKTWIIIHGLLGYPQSLNPRYDNEIAFMGVSKDKAPESAQYVTHEMGFQMLDRNLNSIDFERQYEIEKIEIVNFRQEIDKDIFVNYDGALIFSFEDSRQFLISAYTAPGGMLEFATDIKQINQLRTEGIIRTTVK